MGSMRSDAREQPCSSDGHTPHCHTLLSQHVRGVGPHTHNPCQVQQNSQPQQQSVAGNCHLTRDTAAVVRASSFVPQPLPPVPLQPGGGVVRLQAGRVATDGCDGADGGVDSSSGCGAGRLPASANDSVDLWHFELRGVGLIAPHIAGLLRTPL